jgi:HK97 family phage portal protein
MPVSKAEPRPARGRPPRDAADFSALNRALSELSGMGAKAIPSDFLLRLSGEMDDAPGPTVKFRERTTALDAPQQVSYCYACISRRASAVGSARWYLAKPDGDRVDIEKVDEGLRGILTQPNKLMTFSDLMEAVVWNLDIAGNAYLAWEASNGRAASRGRPDTLWPLRPDWMKIDGGGTAADVVTQFIYRVNNRDVPFKPEDIAWFRYYWPGETRYGMGIVQAMARTLTLDTYATESNLRLFQQGLQIAGAFVTPDKVSPDAVKRLKESVDQRHKGVGRSHRPLVLSEGMDFKQMQFAPKDVEFLEMMKFTRENVCSAFGVPPALVGILEFANYANMDAQERFFFKWTLDALLRKFAGVVTQNIVRKYDDELLFRFESVVPSELAMKAPAWAAMLDRGVMTPNEVREEMAMPPRADGDFFYQPIQMLTVGEGQKIVQAVEIVRPAAKALTGGGEKAAEAQPAPAPRDAVAEMMAALRKFLRKQGDRVAANFGRMADPETFGKVLEPPADPNLFGDYQRARHLKAQQGVNIVWALTDWERDDEVLAADLKDSVSAGFADAGESAMAAMGFELGFDVLNEEALAFSQQYPIRLAHAINEETRTGLMEAIQAGIREGEGIPKIEARLNQAYDYAEGYRAERIARTEVMRAENRGTLEAWRQQGVKSKQWMTFEDDRTCEICRDLDGTAIPADGDFFQSDFAGGSSPPAHPNCRCRMVPSVGAEMAARQELQGKGVGFGFDCYGCDAKTLSDKAVKAWGAHVAKRTPKATARYEERARALARLRGKKKFTSMAKDRDADYMMARNARRAKAIAAWQEQRGISEGARLATLRAQMTTEIESRDAAAMLLREKPADLVGLDKALDRAATDGEVREYFAWRHGLDVYPTDLAKRDLLAKIDAALIGVPDELRSPLNGVQMVANAKGERGAGLNESYAFPMGNDGRGQVLFAEADLDLDFAYMPTHELAHALTGSRGLFSEEFEVNFLPWATARHDVDQALITPHGYAQARKAHAAGLSAEREEWAAAQEDWAINLCDALGIRSKRSPQPCPWETRQKVGEVLGIPTPARMPEGWVP